MIWTNYLNLPWPYVQAVQRHTHARGECDYTITELLAPPQQLALRHRYKDQIEEDVSDRLWSTFGTAWHALLSPGQSPRYYAKIQDKKISGEPDYFDKSNAIIWDWKTTKVSGKASRLPEWEAQLNGYRFLMATNGIQVKGLKILVAYKDWRRSESLRNPSYPSRDIEVLDFPVWSDEKVKGFLSERIALHAATQGVPDDLLPICSPAERWERNEVWAVQKEGSIKAVKGGVHSTLASAESHLATLGDGYGIVHRPGNPMRCLFYCNSWMFCSQRANMKLEEEEKNGGD